jgi:WD40 repeat protein
VGLGFPARSLAFSPDGRLLATASGDGSAGLWSTETGRSIRRLDAGAEVLNALAFSPDGRILAAVGNDDDVRLWDMSELVDGTTEPQGNPSRGRGPLSHPPGMN